jgi:hypothetical protein
MWIMLFFRLRKPYRFLMTYKFTQLDIIRIRGGFGLFVMLSIGYMIEEWYFYSPPSKPMREDVFRQYIKLRKKAFESPENSVEAK